MSEKVKVINLPQGMVSMTCCHCQLSYAVLESFDRARRNDHATFYCPVGHGQSYKDPKTKEESDQKSVYLANLQARVAELERQIAKRPKLAWWKRSKET